jgi:hypothetical protein
MKTRNEQRSPGILKRVRSVGGSFGRALAVVALATLALPVASPALPAQAADCQFILGFKTLHDALPDIVGDCIDNQAFAPNGDAQQHTIKGLLAWRKADNWTAFTDGYHTWVNGPAGIQKRLNTERFPYEAQGPGGVGAAPVEVLPPGQQCPSPHYGFDSACPLGPLTAMGTTIKSRVKSDDLTNDVPNSREAWEFTLSAASGVHIILQDLWYAMGVQVWEKPTQRKILEQDFRAKAEDFQSRVIQFVKPEVIVLNQLPAGTYAIFVYPGADAISPPVPAIPGFDPNRGYTLRVAAGSPACGAAQHDYFQLGLTIQPSPITQFSLITFNAFIDPPYTDLYDFDWTVDGKVVATGARQTYQVAANALGGTGNHQVSVLARGVRQYPDPAPYQSLIPPDVSVQCAFTIQGQ